MAKDSIERLLNPSKPAIQQRADFLDDPRSAAHVPCSRTRFASIRVHVPCATVGVFGSIAAVHVGTRSGRITWL
jgi:hypothetical protein